MNWLLTIPFCVVLVEIVLRLPLSAPLSSLARSSWRAASLVTTTGVSDHWKELAMAAYARRTFIASLQLAGLLAVLLGVAVLMVLALERVATGFGDFILGWSGLAASVAIVTVYLITRRSLRRG